LCFEYIKMMIIVNSQAEQDSLLIKNHVLQDTVKLKPDLKGLNTTLQDSLGLNSDSTILFEPNQRKDSVINKPSPIPRKAEVKISDTTSVCTKNSTADITFYDKKNIITTIKDEPYNLFPFHFTETNKQKQVDSKINLIKYLNPGQDLHSQPIHEDWIIGIILIPVFLYSFVRASSKNILPLITRFFLFRGINDPSSRDIGGIFHWQSTIQNLISFIIMALGAYCAATYYNFTPFGLKGFVIWLIFVAILIFAITIRHIVCIIIGNASGEREIFKEYLVIVYQSYRFSSLLLYFIIILLLYTTILPVQFYFVSGIIVLSIMYLIRIIRLMIIFITRKISVLYMILYLCALELMPVLITVKYISGHN
jgi:Domain of unknown function (DUF4271)